MAVTVYTVNISKIILNFITNFFYLHLLTFFCLHTTPLLNINNLFFFILSKTHTRLYISFGKLKLTSLQATFSISKVSNQCKCTRCLRSPHRTPCWLTAAHWAPFACRRWPMWPAPPFLPRRTWLPPPWSRVRFAASSDRWSEDRIWKKCTWTWWLELSV